MKLPPHYRGLLLVLGLGLLSGLTYLLIVWMGSAARKQDVRGNALQTELFHVLGPACKVLVLNQDLNGDGRPDAVGALLRPSRRILAPNVYWIDRLAVLSVARKRRDLLLEVSTQAIRSVTAEPLVPQEPARHGYLARFDTDARGRQAFRLSLADSLGQDASEPLRFVWVDSLRAYRPELP